MFGVCFNLICKGGTLCISCVRSLKGDSSINHSLQQFNKKKYLPRWLLSSLFVIFSIYNLTCFTFQSNTTCFYLLSNFFLSTYSVNCRGVKQLGGLVPSYSMQVPLSLRLVNLLIPFSVNKGSVYNQQLRMRRSLVNLSGLNLWTA